MPGMPNVVDQIKHFWSSRTGRQKAFLIGGAGATVVLLTLFARLIGTPDYKPLYKDLEPSKKTETRGWGNRAEAEAILAAAREREGG